jgi:hypothetical protein
MGKEADCLLENILLIIAKCADLLPKHQNVYDENAESTHKLDEEKASEIEKLCGLFIGLMEVILGQSPNKCLQFSLLVIEKYFFDKSCVPLQIQILNMMDRLISNKGVSIVESESLRQILLFCFSLINQRNSEFQENNRLFQIISHLYLAGQLNPEDETTSQIELVLLRNLKRAVKDIGHKKGLIFKCQNVLLLILHQMKNLKLILKKENGLLGKRPDSDVAKFYFTCSESMSEILFIVTENAEIDKNDRLRSLSEEILSLTRLLWDPSNFQSDLLQRRLRRSKKKSDLKRKIELLAVTNPEKYSQIKTKLNQRRKKNRSTRNKLKGLYKHVSAAKKLNQF